MVQYNVLLTIPVEMAETLNEISSNRHVSASSIVRDALEAHFEKYAEERENPFWFLPIEEELLV